MSGLYKSISVGLTICLWGNAWVQALGQESTGRHGAVVTHNLGADATRTQAQSFLKAGRIKDAVVLLERAVNSAPESPEAHYDLARALILGRQFARAKGELAVARSLSKGGALAAKANDEMLQLPLRIAAPRAKPLVARLNGRAVPPLAVSLKPRVVAFYALWALPSKQMLEAIEKLKSESPDVEFVAINVDDPQNTPLVSEYDIGPLPTIIFLNRDGTVLKYLLGYAGEDSIRFGIKKLLAKQ